MKFLITVVSAEAANSVLPDLLRWFGWSEGRDWHATLDDQAWDRQHPDTPEPTHNRALSVELRPGATAERLIGTLGAWLRAQPEASIPLIVRLPSGQEMTVSDGDDLEELRRSIPELIRPPSTPTLPRTTPGGTVVQGRTVGGDNYAVGRPPGPPLDPDDDWPRR